MADKAAHPAGGAGSIGEGQGLPPAARWAAMSGLCLGVFMATMDISIVNVALPTLVQELHSDFTMMQWVPLAYVLMLTSLMLGAARLGDLLGRKRVYLAGLAIFTLGSLLCGLAHEAGWLIGSRAVQGLGSAAMQALGVALVTEVFPANQRGKALGTIGGVVSCGLAAGPALGGMIIEAWGWRYIFLVNLAPGLAAALVVWRTLPAAKGRRDVTRFDLPGAILLFLALVSYAMGMTLGQRFGFGHPASWPLMAAAAALAVVFIRVERRTDQPMLEMDIFSDRVLAANLAMTFLVFINIGGFLIIPFFLELVMGLSTGQAGLMMMVVPLTMGLASPLAGILSDHLGPRGVSLAGLACLVAGCLTLAFMDQETSPAGYAWRAVLMGVGMGAFQPSNNSAVMGSLPPHRLGVGSGLLALGRTLGNATGISLLGAIFYAQALAASPQGGKTQLADLSPSALSVGLRGSLLTAAAFVAAALALAWWSQRRSRRRAA